MYEMKVGKEEEMQKRTKWDTKKPRKRKKEKYRMIKNDEEEM